MSNYAKLNKRQQTLLLECITDKWEIPRTIFNRAKKLNLYGTYDGVKLILFKLSRLGYVDVRNIDDTKGSNGRIKPKYEFKLR